MAAHKRCVHGEYAKRNATLHHRGTALDATLSMWTCNVYARRSIQRLAPKRYTRNGSPITATTMEDYEFAWRIFDGIRFACRRSEAHCREQPPSPSLREPHTFRFVTQTRAVAFSRFSPSLHSLSFHLWAAISLPRRSLIRTLNAFSIRIHFLFFAKRIYCTRLSSVKNESATRNLT